MTRYRFALVLVLAMMAVAGCTLNKSDVRRDPLVTKFGNNGGQLIEPRRVHLKVAILSRPLRDEAINDALWSMADEQSVPLPVQRALEVNGLRIGLITGELPHDVDAILKATGPQKVEPAEFERDDGDFAMIAMGNAVSEVSLLLNREGRAFGKPYRDANGWFRVTASQEGLTAVKLRFVPEIHHGPMRRSYGALPTGSPYMPQEFMQKDGQQEEHFRELAASLVLQPGQIAVLGCRAEANRSLGAYLFTQPEANSDRLVQRVVLIWASRSNMGQPAAEGPPSLVPVDPPKS